MSFVGRFVNRITSYIKPDKRSTATVLAASVAFAPLLFTPSGVRAQKSGKDADFNLDLTGLENAVDEAVGTPASPLLPIGMPPPSAEPLISIEIETAGPQPPISASDIVLAEKAVEGGTSISIVQYLLDEELVNKDILGQVADAVKSGLALSAAFEKHGDRIPGILIQMILVGEETGSLGVILKTLTDFYKREVDDAVDTLVGLIEPIMIVVLGLGVGILLVSVLMPIYNMAGGIS